jgi:molybdopterin molybdotransferase
MKIFGFAGWSGSGKTTLIEQLIPRFVQRGLRVSLIKHAHHTFDVDQPGKDSYRHRHAGAAEILVTSSRRWVLMHELRGAHEPAFDEQVKRLSPATCCSSKAQVRADSEAGSLARRDRRAAPAPERPAYRRRGERCEGRDEAAAARSERRRQHRAVHRQETGAEMNQGLLSVDDALARLLAEARPVAEIEEVATLGATNRILARSQRSTMDVPPMDNSAMDGFAVRVADGARLKVAQKIMAGSVGKPLAPGTAARIFTGAPIPPGADAVVMQEHTTSEGNEVILKKKPTPGEWIRRVGSDVNKGDEILPAGKRLLPQDTGLAASVGIKTLPVFRKIRLGLFFTGDELVMPGEPLAPGRIYNSNRFTLRGLGEVFGCDVRDYGIVPDNLDATREALRRAAAETDVIVTSGGVSVGEADYVKPAVEAEGRLLMWRIAMKPGRPLAFGSVGKSFFIGLPGNPVSSFVTFLIFVRPFLLKMQGLADVRAKSIVARADFDWPEPDARREFLRVKWNAQGGLDLYPTQDSAVLTSTAWADGLVDNPAGHAIRKSEHVRFLPYSELYW